MKEALRRLLDSLVDQTVTPDEVVICDGGSTDETLEILREYQRWLPLKIVLAPGSNISQGRNRAIETATGEIITATDAGVLLSPVWLEELIRLIQTNEATVVSGWSEPDPYTDFEVVMAATVLLEREDINHMTFLPSSRSVAFCKTAREAVGGYPEWLDYSEDLVFDMAPKKMSVTSPLRRGRRLLSSAWQLALVRQAILQLRTRRRQSQLVA